MAQEEELSLDDKVNDHEKRSLILIIVVEFFAAMVSICNGANLLMQMTSSCVGFRFLGITLIIIGVTLFILLCTNCSFARANEQSVVNCKFLCFSVPLVFALLVLGIFALEVSTRGGGGKSKSEVYDVGAFSKWMQSKVEDNWEDYYKKDVIKNKGILCNEFPGLSGVDLAFEFGCCHPPKGCNFSYTNQNVWVIKPGNGNNTKDNDNDDDCNRWDDDPNTLCFNCESCKAGFLQDVTSHWLSTGLGLILMVVLILLLGIPFICLTMLSSDSFHGYMPLV